MDFELFDVKTIEQLDNLFPSPRGIMDFDPPPFETIVDRGL